MSPGWISQITVEGGSNSWIKCIFQWRAGVGDPLWQILILGPKEDAAFLGSVSRFLELEFAKTLTPKQQ